METWRGLRKVSSAELAIGDGALGFWKALPQVFPSTKTQRCWVHKTANVLNKLPKRQQPEAKRAIWEIYRAESKTEANKALERFSKTYQAKYPEAVSHPSLLGEVGCNPLPDQGYSDRDGADGQFEVCNAESVQLSLVQIREAIATAQEQRRQQQAQTEAAHRQMKQQAAQQAMVDRMRGYLASEDPILMGEALRWLRSHPEYRELLL